MRQSSLNNIHPLHVQLMCPSQKLFLGGVTSLQSRLKSHEPETKTEEPHVGVFPAALQVAMRSARRHSQLFFWTIDNVLSAIARAHQSDTCRRRPPTSTHSVLTTFVSLRRNLENKINNSLGWRRSAS